MNELYNPHTNNKRQQQGFNQARRQFLERAALMSSGTIAGIVSAQSGYDVFVRMMQTGDADTQTPETPNEHALTQPETSTTVREHDLTVVAQTLFDQIAERGHVSLTPETIRSLVAHFTEEHSEGGPEHPALLAGLQRMAPWKISIESELSKAGVTPSLALLSIAESHFQPHAVSEAGAAGPFQFMRATAIREPASLTISDAVDERRDPIQSARAAAALLKDNYWHLNKGWDAALAGYNGGYIWRYAKEHAGEAWTYEDFLQHMETKINTIIHDHDIRIDNNDVYVIQPGDTISELAQQFAIPMDTLKEWNGMTNDNLVAGARFRLSPTNNEHTPKAGMRALAGYFENMHYPAKFYGILRAVQALETQPETVPYQFRELRITTDTSRTLTGLSKQFALPQDTLIALNPGIINPTTTLPMHTIVRVPA